MFLNDDLLGKASSTHTHDDRYYTKAEINTLLAGISSHTLRSPNTAYTATIQDDGNFVVYQGSTAIFCTKSLFTQSGNTLTINY